MSFTTWGRGAGRHRVVGASARGRHGERRRRTRLAAYATALAIGAGSLAAASPAEAAGYCRLGGLTPNRWTGAADHTSWNLAGNWSLGRVPDDTDEETGYVCIATSDTVVLRAGESARLQAIDLSGSTTLDLRRGSALYVFGAQTTRASSLRAGTTVNLLGTLGGPGRYNLSGTMHWSSGQDGAATLTSRVCGIGGTCSGPAPTPGLLVVGDSALLDVDDRGVNLFDSYRIVVRGLLRLSGPGSYVAADRGTTLELRPRTGGGGVGELRIENDGGWYEGFTRYGQTSLSTLVNAGLIHKAGGTGTSVVSATYKAVKGGTAQVDSGTLSLPPTVAHQVRVGAGDGYGFGDCATPSYGCAPVADPADPVTSTATVPGSDGDGAGLVVRRVTGSVPAGSLTGAVEVSATGLAASASDPAVLQLRYDASVIGARTPATVVVLRRPSSGGGYATVPDCLATGAPPAGAVACVDRRGLATSSRQLPDGDVVMVVRTQGFSRWVAR